MEDILRKIKETAENAAVEAGEYAALRVGKIGEIFHKGGHNDLVTDVDRQCETIIINRVKKDFPNHGILAEESGGRVEDGKFCWVIDPIDGTTNYTHGFPFFCTSVGVMYGGETKIGVVYDPSRKELFSAEKGQGAFLNGNRINVSGTENICDSLISTGFAYNVCSRVGILPYFEKILRHAQAVRRPGSAAMDLCYMACGRFDGFFEFGLNPWDTAAGLLIVREAGGTVTTLDGSHYDIFKEEIVASNGRIHEEFLRLLNTVIRG